MHGILPVLLMTAATTVGIQVATQAISRARVSAAGVADIFEEDDESYYPLPPSDGDRAEAMVGLTAAQAWAQAKGRYGRVFAEDRAATGIQWASERSKALGRTPTFSVSGPFAFEAQERPAMGLRMFDREVVPSGVRWAGRR